ncbi:MAG: ribonuclease R [Bacillota bacterium]|nr:ribonuclease R [Bacillota bacterium]
MTIKDNILEIIKNLNRPVDQEEIAQLIGVKGKEAKMVYQTLKQMEKENLLSLDRKSRYKLVDLDNSFVGQVDMAQKGYAFVIVEGREDIFVARDDLNTAMDQDQVLVVLKDKDRADGKDEGYVKKIISRNIKNLVGKVSKKPKDDFAFIIPDDKAMNYDIFVKAKNLKGALDGQKVYIEITKYPQGDKNPEGQVVEILGYPEDQGIDVLSVAYNHGIRMVFPDKVLREARALPESVSQKEMEGRKDFREDLIFTIDGEDAKDLDDAVGIELLDNGNYLLGVHIADVAHYVREYSATDIEAQKRGNSVYLIDRVVPMLPEELSNGICSLNPDQDRLTLSLLMEISPKGKLIKSQIYQGLIRSKARLNYTDVSKYLEEDDQEAKDLLGPDICQALDYMADLMKVLNQVRHDKGAIDFNFAESKIDLDEKGKVVDIYKEERRIANRLIEEFMLITNQVVSETYFWQELPFLYRIHEQPDEEKLRTFINFVRGLGYSVKTGQNEIHPRELQKIIEDIEGKKEEMLVSRMMLRSLKKAKYSEENDIHFGLSSKYYSHFTAPIRRYPDLQIHRIIKDNIKGRLNASRIDHYQTILAEVAKHSSKMERLAEEAERDVEKIKKAEYMVDYIGQVYEGIVSGVTSFGIFVELANTVEGLVSYSSLSDDYYYYDRETMTAIGEKTKKTYSLGDKVKIQVYDVDVEKYAIDFIIVD